MLNFFHVLLLWLYHHKPKKYAKLESTSLYCHYIAIALIFIQDNLVALALHGGTMHYRSLPRGHMWIMQVYFY